MPNVWEKRKQAFEEKAAIVPTSQTEEEMMIQQALELSKMETRQEEERRRWGYLLGALFVNSFFPPENWLFKLHVISGLHMFFFIPYLKTFILFNYFKYYFYACRFHRIALHFGLLTALFPFNPLPDSISGPFFWDRSQTVANSSLCSSNLTLIQTTNLN